MGIESNFIAINIQLVSNRREDLLDKFDEMFNHRDWGFLIYSPNRIKLFFGDNEVQKTEETLRKLKNEGVLIAFEFIEDLNDLFWDMCLACAARKFSRLIKVALNDDELINKLVTIPHVSACAYAPLHHICNQLNMDYKTELNFRKNIFEHPKYKENFKEIANLRLR